MKNILASVSIIIIAGSTKNPQATENRIVGGKCAAIKKYPFFVSVVVEAQDRYDRKFIEDQIICGGSIIGPRWIITSIACIILIQKAEVDLNDLYVRSGTAYWINKTTGNKHRILTYHIEDLEDVAQIALIKVNPSFANADRIKVKLAGSNYPQKYSDTYTALGFGFESIDANTFSNCLKLVDLKIIARETCKKLVENIQATLNKKFMCAGWFDTTRGTCTGDTGGPLVKNGVLIGIISMLTPCELMNFAPIVDVSKFQGQIVNYEHSMTEKIGVVFVDK